MVLYVLQDYDHTFDSDVNTFGEIKLQSNRKNAQQRTLSSEAELLQIYLDQ